MINREIGPNTVIWSLAAPDRDVILFVDGETFKLEGVREWHSDGTYIDYDLDVWVRGEIGQPTEVTPADPKRAAEWAVIRDRTAEYALGKLK